MIALGLLVVAASVYLVYVLEILKFRRLDAIASAPAASGGLSRGDRAGRGAGTSRPARFEAVSPSRNAPPGDAVCPRAGTVTWPRAEQRVGERQVDQERVGAEDERGGAQAPIAADGG